MIEFVMIAGIFVFSYYIIYCIGQTLLLIAAYPDIIRRFDEIRFGNIYTLINTDFCIPITIVMPVFNMGDIMMESIQSVLNSNYKEVNIIIVNDGSTDDSLERLIKKFDLYKTPHVIKEKIKTSNIRAMYESKIDSRISVLDKEHGPSNNAADSLNAGLNACRTPIFLTIDSDTIVEEDALTRMMFSFIARAHCIVVGGAVYVINENKTKAGRFLASPKLPHNWIVGVQVCQYFRSFLFGRAGWTPFGGAMCYAGAFTLFEAEIVRQIGGFDTNNFSYDAEIIIHLHEYMLEKKYPYSFEFTPGAFCWTEVPSTLKRLWRQRNFWQRGLLRGFWSHKKMFFNPRFKTVGMFTYPFTLFFEILAPVIELTSYILVVLSYILGIFHLDLLILFFALAIGYVAFLSIATILINLLTFNKYSRWTDVLRIFILSLTEVIFFRQFLTVCTCFASVHYLYNRYKGKSW